MEQIDVAVVGGGISGVYSAWRLAEQQRGKIVVFEGHDHIGGRLLSVRPPDIPNMVAELGGMRILPKVQPRITRLLEVLNSEGQKIETYDFPVDQDQNIAYLRGRWLRLSDFTKDPDKVPYHLSFLEKGGTAGSIIVNAIEQIVPGVTNPNLEEAARRKLCQEADFCGKPLYQQGFWNVLSRVISGEAYLLGVDAGGYNSTLSNWNAADAIPWYLSDFGVKPEYKAFKAGFQQVPLSLAELFRKNGEIRTGWQLLDFDWSGERTRLRFRLGESKDTREVETGALILAMPRRSLDLLMPSSPPLQSIQELVASVTPRPLFKLFTTYSNPWWRAAGYTGPHGFVPVEAGRTVTDLPVRQTYYWPRDDGKPAQDGSAMLMASYDDGTNIGFWDGLRARRGEAWKDGREITPPANPYRAAAPQAGTWSKYKPSEAMVVEVNRQLGMIHGLSFTPDVRNAAFRDWGDDPFGGGWNSWNIGVKSPEVKERIVKPIEDRQFFICGEAYSDAQGWVEGALQTADLMLEKFDLRAL